MKKAILLRIAACMVIGQIVNPSFGQQADAWKVRRAYLNGSAGMNGNATLQFNLHFNNRWVGFASYDEGSPKAKDLPSDYIEGQSMIFGWESKDAGKEDYFHLYTVGMGKVVTRRSDKAWVMVTGGLSFGNFEKAQFQRQAIQTFNLIIFSGRSSNYATTYEKMGMFGLNTGLQGHVNLARVIGLSSGIQALITNRGVFPSFQLGMNLGLMRPSKKNMIRNPK